MRTVSKARQTRILFFAAASVFAMVAGPAFAQEAVEQDPAAQDASTGGDERRSSADMLTEEILVTGRRVGRGEALQETPMAVTAFGEAQLEAANVRDLQGLSFSIPNVALDTGGAFPGIQNFSIRGLGVVGTVPSLDPTVGVLVDGVYLGSNYGVLTDLYDLEGVEILRGPQGVAFGRNVTGGAILVRTSAPTDKFEAKFRASVETDLEYGLAGTVNVPITEGISARLTSYYSKDEGYFKSAVSNDFGESETFVIRPAVRIQPSDAVDLILRYEHGKVTGDASVWQNGNFSTGFDTMSNSEGSNRLRWDQFIAEVNIDVPLFDGTITNIFGWRDVSQDTLGTDFDGRPTTIFHADIAYDQDQISNEFRFSGKPLDGVQFTIGAYYFTQNLGYIEQRVLSGGAVVGTLGGQQDSWTAAAFTAVDVDLSNTLTLNLGLRYTREKKTAEIASFRTGAGSPCNFAAGSCVNDFADSEDWNSLMPKVGLQWQPSDDLQIYGYWARGFRSGGYNFRNTNPAAAPGPYDQETQDAFELGFKSDLLDRRLRVNGAFFWSKLTDLQRDINFPDPVAGFAQVIRNSADARIRGVELEFTARPIENLVLNGTVGYTDADYTKIFFDINNDRVVDQRDLDLKLVRVAPWTFGFGANYEVFVGGGSVTFRGQYSHRDRAAAQDPNTAFLPKANIVDASIIIRPADSDLSVSLFGRNLTNEVTWSSANVAGFGPFQAVNKGRTYGAELNYRF